VCFDVTNCGTLDSVPDWIELAQKERYGRIKKPLIVLVGNKVDEQNQREVSYECANTVADLFQIPYVETSALTGFNVELLFRKIAKDVYVEELARQAQNEDYGIDNGERQHRKAIKLIKSKERKKSIIGKHDWCRCS